MKQYISIALTITVHNFRLAEQTAAHGRELEAIRITSLSTEQDLARSRRELVAARKELLRRDESSSEAKSLAMQLKSANEKAYAAAQRCDALELDVEEIQKVMDINERQRRQIQELNGELSRCAEQRYLEGGTF